MTGLVRKAILLSVGAMLIAGAAYASVPCASCSTVPAGIRLVGTSAGVADPVGTFSVTVRDLANNLIANSSVVIDFSGCGPDIKVQSTQPFAGLIADCGTQTVRKLTDGAGVATFSIVGRATLGPFSTFQSGKVYADGVLLGNITTAAFDLDGAGGVGAVDLSAWVGDFLAANAAQRGDYDFNGGLGAVDLSVWTGAFLAAGSTASAAPICP